jgi:hypothetical protein
MNISVHKDGNNNIEISISRELLFCRAEELLEHSRQELLKIM